MNSNKKGKKIWINFRLDKEQLDLINEIVIKNSSTKSIIIRKLLESALAEYIKKSVPKPVKKTQLTPEEFAANLRPPPEVVELQIEKNNELL